MGERSEEDKRQEVSAIIAAQIANGGQRDAFVALGHTVLFTASIAFMGDIRPASEIEWTWLLFLAWASSVIGLFALTWSFREAHIAGNDRLAKIHDDHIADGLDMVDITNGVALWTFPISMLATASFAGINLWSVI